MTETTEKTLARQFYDWVGERDPSETYPSWSPVDCAVARWARETDPEFESSGFRTYTREGGEMVVLHPLFQRTWGEWGELSSMWTNTVDRSENYGELHRGLAPLMRRLEAQELADA